MNFRTLRADEIECRVATIKENGLSLLLYKDARVDQNILDETVGALNWQRHHSRENANCIVSIWDDEKKQWVEKEDVGKESYSEKEKGLASDSFKRACFNWGIGRELYSAPFIWITQANIKKDSKGKFQCYDKFVVSNIEYDSRRNIVALTIKNASGRTVYTFGNAKQEAPKPVEKTGPEVLSDMAFRDGVDVKKLCALYKVDSIEEFSEKKVQNAVGNWNKIMAMCKVSV